MKRNRSYAEQILLTAIPALFLVISSLYLVITDGFRVSPYLMLCVSGLLALPACLLWGIGLFTRMVRSGARNSMLMTTILLTLWALLYFLQGMFSSVAGVADILYVLTLLPAVCVPAFLYSMVFASLHTPDEQKPGAGYSVLLAVGGVGWIAALICGLQRLPVTLFVGYLLHVYVCIGSIATQILLLVRRWSVRAIPAAILVVVEAAVFAVAALELFGLNTMLLAYILPLFVFAFVELCFHAEMLPDGRDWAVLLQHSTFPIQLMDTEGTVLYGSEHAHPVASNHKAAILNNRYHVSQILERDMQLYAGVVRGGYALYQKDLRDLHALQETLDKLTGELNDTLEILSQQNEIEEKLQSAIKKNEFFAEQEKKIQEKTDCAALMLRCAAAAAPEPGFRRAVVTRANLLVTYIQQLGVLLEAARTSELLPVHYLRDALEASAKAATAAGIRCRVYHVAQGSFSADVLLSMYDLYEMILEDVLSGEQKTLEIRLRNEQSGLRLILTIKDTTMDVMSHRIDHIIVQTAALGGAARFNVDGGDVSVFIEFLEGGAANA